MLWIIPLLILSTYSIEKYGPNKPHMMFQIGQRNKETVSFGWGYFMDSGHNISDIRLKYENTNNDMYCNILSHNGQTHFKQQVHDTRYNLDSLIKYQLINSNTWQAQIQMQHESDGESKINAFVYMAIENNDYHMVNKQKIQSPRNLILKDNVQKSTKFVEVINNDYLTNVFTIKATSKAQVFGMNLNVSDNWNSRNFLSHFAGVKQVYNYPDLQRSDKKQLREWQDSMVNVMKDQDFYDKKFTFVIINLEFKENEKIYIRFENKANIESEFDYVKFNKTDLSLNKLYQQQEKSIFLQHVQSNLLAGIAYYYGPLYTQHSLVTQEQTFTHSTTPSRLIFPRSFLWDDGFHMMVLVKNYKHLVIRFLNQWMDKIDIFGWIARQQIRGYEVSSMMPQIKFVFQDIFQQNPPTLMLPIQYLIDHDPKNPQLIKLLTQNFWKIEKWYRYFKQTQSHYDMTDREEIEQQIKFRWRCKDSCENGNFMGSGLDDYPRQDSGERSKQHVDIISWLYLFSQTLQKIANFIGQNKASRFYHEQKLFYNQTLYKQYLDKDNLFKDIVVSHSHNINKYITHIGYINLFPFFFGMIPDNSPQFNAALQIMKNEQILWSEDGIRSLSITDQMYGKGDNYWRGAVWMPINYLILRACKLYYPQSTRQFYQDLKSNIITTIQRNYNETGYLYQNYHLGKGNRGFPFYGWTSLVNSIILEVY